MRKWVLILAACSALSAGVAISVADDMPMNGPTTAPSTQPTAVNSKCPVTGDPVDPSVPTVVYDGKVIGFCCSDCIAKFKADPAKYAANIK